MNYRSNVEFSKRMKSKRTACHESPAVTLERLARLESVMLDEIRELGKLVNGK